LAKQGVKQELARGALVTFLANSVGKATVFLGYIFLARWLGVEGFGVVNIVIAITSFLAIFASLGLPFFVLRFVAAYASEDRWSDIRLLLPRCNKIVLISSLIIMSVAALVIIFLLDIGEETETALLLGLLLIPLLCLSGQRQQTLRALKHMIAFRVSENIVVYLAIMLIGALFWQAGAFSSGAGMTARIGAEIIALMTGVWLLHRALKPHAGKTNTPKPPMNLRGMLGVSLPLMLAYFADRIIGLVDVAFLGMLTTAEETGMYTAAARIALVSSMGQQAINAIAAPLISASYQKGDLNVIKRILLWSCLGSGVFGLIVCIGTGIFSDFILGLFGEDFKQAWPLLFILLFGQLVSSLFGPVDFVLSMTGRQKELSIVVSIGAVATLILCPLLISFYGALGAAIATVIAILIWKLAAFAVVWSKLLNLKTDDEPIAGSPAPS